MGAREAAGAGASPFRVLITDESGTTRCAVPLSREAFDLFQRGADRHGLSQEEHLSQMIDAAASMERDEEEGLAAARGDAGPTSEAAPGSVAVECCTEKGTVFARFSLSAEYAGRLDYLAEVVGEPVESIIKMAVAAKIGEVESGAPAGSAGEPWPKHVSITTSVEAARPAGMKTATAPMRSEPLAMDVARDRRFALRQKDSLDQLEIEFFGMLGCRVFDRVSLLDFLCGVFETHRQYLATVVAPELDAGGQVSLLETLSYACSWRRQMADGGKVKDPLKPCLSIGLAARQGILHEDFGGWLTCALMELEPVIARHFFKPDAPAESAVEWADALTVAAEASRDALELRDPGLVRETRRRATAEVFLERSRKFYNCPAGVGEKGVAA